MIVERNVDYSRLVDGSLSKSDVIATLTSAGGGGVQLKFEALGYIHKTRAKYADVFKQRE